MLNFEDRIYVRGNLVSWRRNKQGVVTRSRAKAKFGAMAQDICEGLWIRIVLEELKLKIELPSIAHNLVQHDRTNHIEIDRHFK